MKISMQVRAILLSLSALGAACGVDNSTSNEQPDASVSLCGAGCGGGCAANERCLGGASPASLYGFASRCARTCATTADCGAGLICIAGLAGESTQAPVCLPPAAPPASCGHVDCSSSLEATCFDANTLARPAGDWCGWEHVSCPKGCAYPSTDGGHPSDAAVGPAFCLP